jgi:hypothetical protein
MAITLPTLTVPDAQGTRILDAYKAKFGTTTNAETATAFKKWLAGEVRAVVVAHEAQQIDETNNANKRTALAAVEAALPDPNSVT